MGIAEVRETIRACQFCFMCRYACPTFLAIRLESVTPRGYALMLATVDQGQQDWTGDMVDRFYQCTLCGLCRQDCEYHWPEDELVRNAREDIVASGRAPARVEQAARTIRESNPGWEGIEGLPAGVIGKQKPEVLYLAGCQTRQSRPEIVAANAKIFQALGLDWGVLAEEGCCGASLYDLGYTDEARHMARRLAERIVETRPGLVVTGCSHCYRALVEFYPQWHLALPEEIKVLHTSQYFSRMLGEGRLKLNPTAHEGVLSYHDPCQLGRKMGVYEAPRQLIEAASGSPPAEMFHSRELAECCGAGSAMMLTDPETALKVARVRLDRAAENNTRTLVTACQNCKTALVGANGGQINILELSEFLAAHLEGD